MRRCSLTAVSSIFPSPDRLVQTPLLPLRMRASQASVTRGANSKTGARRRMGRTAHLPANQLVSGRAQKTDVGLRLDQAARRDILLSASSLQRCHLMQPVVGPSAVRSRAMAAQGGQPQRTSYEVASGKVCGDTIAYAPLTHGAWNCQTRSSEFRHQHVVCHNYAVWAELFVTLLARRWRRRRSGGRDQPASFGFQWCNTSKAIWMAWSCTLSA